MCLTADTTVFADSSGLVAIGRDSPPNLYPPRCRVVLNGVPPVVAADAEALATILAALPTPPVNQEIQVHQRDGQQTLTAWLGFTDPDIAAEACDRLGESLGRRCVRHTRPRKTVKFIACDLFQVIAVAVTSETLGITLPSGDNPIVDGYLGLWADCASDKTELRLFILSWIFKRLYSRWTTGVTSRGKEGTMFREPAFQDVLAQLEFIPATGFLFQFELRDGRRFRLNIRVLGFTADQAAIQALFK